MADITDFSVVAQRTPKFYEIGRELGDFINALDLPQPEHNRLVSLILDQVTEGEKAAFCQGYLMGEALA